MSEFAPVAVIERSDFDEGVHFGAAVAIDADGAVVAAAGDPLLHIYPRSALKPLQADAMLAAGLELTREQLALACASHAGTEAHVSVVRSTLAAAGLSETALDNTPDLPLDKVTARNVLALGGAPSRLMQNCSGKHAAMLATCVVNGWPTDGYLDLEHPLQQAILAHVAELAGGVVHTGVDGCGAPTHVTTLAGIASAFARLASQRGAVWQAMTASPMLVGGEGRDVTLLMRSVPDLMAKDGAEGVFVAALPDGRCAAVKISDGASRAVGVVLASALRAIDIDVDPLAFGEPILGHGRPVGAVRPVDGLMRPTGRS